MDYKTLLFVWDAFSFILFLVVILATIHEPKGFKKNLHLVAASFLMFLGLFLFYREWNFLTQGRHIPSLSFFTYGLSAGAHMLIVSMITYLYRKRSFTPKIYILILLYSLGVGLVMEFDANYGNFVSKHILIAAINIIPQFHLFAYIIKYDKKYYRSIFIYQILMLVLIYIIKTINLIMNYDTISLINPTRLDEGLLMVANVVIYSYFISYLFIKGVISNNELSYHKRLLEASLSEAVMLSENDPLTNVFNRRKAEEIMSEFKEFDQINPLDFSLIMIDVDKFKVINDTLGHQVGDEVLVFVAETLKTCLRRFDIISRYGGDEFLVILPNTDMEKGKIVVEKLKESFKSSKCLAINEYVTVSIGLASNGEVENSDDLISLADERMYKDKNKSKQIII